MVLTTIWQGSLRTPSKSLDGISITSVSSGGSASFPSPPPTSSSPSYVHAQSSSTISAASTKLSHPVRSSSATVFPSSDHCTQIRRIKLNFAAGRPAAPKVETTGTWINRLKNRAHQGEFVVRNDHDPVLKLADLDPSILSRSVEEDFRYGYKLRAILPTEPSGLLYFHAALIPEPKSASLSLDTHGRTLHGLLIDFMPFEPDHNVPSLSLLVYGIKSTPLVSTSGSDQKRSKKPSLSIFVVPFPSSGAPCSPPPSTASTESAVSSSAPNTPCLSSYSQNETMTQSSTPSTRLRPRGTFSPRHPRPLNIACTSSTLPSLRDPSPIPIISPAQFSKTSKDVSQSSNVSPTVAVQTTSRSISALSVCRDPYDDQRACTNGNKISFPTSRFTFTAPSVYTVNTSIDRPVGTSTTIKRIVLKKSSLYSSSKPEVKLAQTPDEKKQKEDLSTSDPSDLSSSSSSESSSDLDLKKKEEKTQKGNESSREGREEGNLETRTWKEEEKEEMTAGDSREPGRPTQIHVPDSSPPSHIPINLPTAAPLLLSHSSGFAAQPNRPRLVRPLRKTLKIDIKKQSAHASTWSHIESKPKAKPTRPAPLPDVGFSHPFSSDEEDDEGPIKPVKSELFKDRVSRGDLLIEQGLETTAISSARSPERMDLMKRKRETYGRPVNNRSKRLRRVKEEDVTVNDKSLKLDEATPPSKNASRETLRAGYTALNKLLLRKSVEKALQAKSFHRSHPEFQSVWAWVVRGCAFSLREVFSAQELEECDLAESIQTHIKLYLPCSIQLSQSSSTSYSDVIAFHSSNESALLKEEHGDLKESKADDERWMHTGDLMAFAEIWLAAGEIWEQKDRPDTSALAVERVEAQDDASSDLGEENFLSEGSSDLSTCSSSCSTSPSASPVKSDFLSTPCSSSSLDLEPSFGISMLQKLCPTSDSLGLRIPTHSKPHRDHMSSQIRTADSQPSPVLASAQTPETSSNIAVYRTPTGPNDDSTSEINQRASRQPVPDLIDEDETEDETLF